MENSNKLMNLRAPPYSTRDKLLPPKSSLRTAVSLPCASFPNTVLGSDTTNTNRNSLEEKTSHQRCSSDIFLVEQPSWLDDLLGEPDTSTEQPKCHRRSASDSSTYFGSIFNHVEAPQGNNNNNSKDHRSAVAFTDPWNSSSLNKTPNSAGKQCHSSTGSDSSVNSVLCLSGGGGGNGQLHAFKNSLPSKESENLSTVALKKHNQQEDSGAKNNETFNERSNAPTTRPHAMSKSETKRDKQQSAHRSRVRKLQYIAELERNLQVLQAEGTEASAQLEFLDQQNLILGMENRALRQRLDSLSQEHLIKHMEQDMLEREIERLQTLYQIQMQRQKQQQHQQLHHPKHRRKQSKKIDSHFANIPVTN